MQISEFIRHFFDVLVCKLEPAYFPEQWAIQVTLSYEAGKTGRYIGVPCGYKMYQINCYNIVKLPTLIHICDTWIL